jgi:hypothetical protein
MRDQAGILVVFIRHDASWYVEALKTMLLWPSAISTIKIAIPLDKKNPKVYIVESFLK